MVKATLVEKTLLCMRNLYVHIGNIITRTLYIYKPVHKSTISHTQNFYVETIDFHNVF